MARWPTSSPSTKGPEKSAKFEKAGRPPSLQARKKSWKISPHGRGNVGVGGLKSWRSSKREQLRRAAVRRTEDHPLFADKNAAGIAQGLPASPYFFWISRNSGG